MGKMDVFVLDGVTRMERMNRGGMMEVRVGDKVMFGRWRSGLRMNSGMIKRK